MVIMKIKRIQRILLEIKRKRKSNEGSLYNFRDSRTPGGFDDHKNKLRIYGGIFK